MNKKKLMFVDDEVNFLSALRRTLRAHRDEWDMTFLTSADEALRAVHGNDFDVIVSDVNMPGKDGFVLLQELRANARTKDVPIIILTGNAESNLKRRALDLGATDLLNKPVIPEDLLARLHSALRIKQYEDRLRDQNSILEKKVGERTRDLECSRRDIIWRLAKAGEFRDEDTGDHVVRVACCARILARAMELDSANTDIIFLTSPLHDLGKIGVPDGVLLKKGKLTGMERQIMEAHCEIGASVLMEQPKGMGAFLEAPDAQLQKDVNAMKEPLREMASEIAMSHHEKWDGSGYPKGLKGEDIPVSGRIVTIADVYDALRSKRPYKEQLDIETTMSIMSASKGTHFDPFAYECFEKVVDQFEEMRAQYAQ